MQEDSELRIKLEVDVINIQKILVANNHPYVKHESHRIKKHFLNQSFKR